MFIIGKSISYDPIKLQVTFRGETIDLYIRPLDPEAMQKITEKARVYRYAEHPVTGKQELGAMVDDALLDAEMFDWMIADWKGVYSAKDEPAPATKQNKSKLVYQNPGPGDTPLWKTVLEAGSPECLRRCGRAWRALGADHPSPPQAFG